MNLKVFPRRGKEEKSQEETPFNPRTLVEWNSAVPDLVSHSSPISSASVALMSVHHFSSATGNGGASDGPPWPSHKTTIFGKDTLPSCLRQFLTSGDTGAILTNPRSIPFGAKRPTSLSRMPPGKKVLFEPDVTASNVKTVPFGSWALWS